MTEYGSGGTASNRQLYGVILRDKIKTADLATLQAYHVVAKDLLQDGDDSDLRAAVADLEKVLAAKK
jgi:hypothetical protein